MTHTFEHAELSVDTGFHERGEDRLRDEKDRSRTDDDGCPSDRSLDLRRSVTTLRSVLLIIAFLAALPVLARAQSLTDSGTSSGAVASAPATTHTGPYLHASDPDHEAPQLLLRRVWPVSHRRRRGSRLASTKRTMRRRSGSKAPRVMASVSAPTSASRAVTTTTRYALAEAFQRRHVVLPL